MTHRARPWSVVAVALLGVVIAAPFVGGCNDAPRSAASAKPTAAPGPDVGSYCASVCKRAAECAVERAEGLVKTGSDVDKAALVQAKADAQRNESSCVTSCAADAVEPSEVAKIRRAEGCVHQSTCAFVERCLRDVAGESPG